MMHRRGGGIADRRFLPPRQEQQQTFSPAPPAIPPHLLTRTTIRTAYQRCSKINRVGQNNRNRIVNNPDYSITIILKVLLLYDYLITIILKVL